MEIAKWGPARTTGMVAPTLGMYMYTDVMAMG